LLTDPMLRGQMTRMFRKSEDTTRP
jgi:hypothetical protein